MLKLFAVLVGIAIILLAGPLLMIWSLNTLFPTLAIPYTLDTWAAAVFLGGLVSAKIK